MSAPWPSGTVDLGQTHVTDLACGDIQLTAGKTPVSALCLCASCSFLQLLPLILRKCSETEPACWFGL